DHQRAPVRFEEPGDIGDVGFDAEELADEYRAGADDQVLAERIVSGPEEGGPGAERGAHERADLPVAGVRRVRREQQARHRERRAPRSGPAPHRTKIERKSRANGETITSPAASEKGRAS